MKTLMLLFVGCLFGLMCGCSESEHDQIRRKAAEGDTMAQTALGTWYFNGFDVKQDYEEALRWFRKAAEQGHELSHISFTNFSMMEIRLA